LNYYRRFIGDYARDTRHLSMLEHGAYGLLLDTIYSTEKPLPKDLAILYKICGASTKRERNAVKSVLSEFFCEKPTGFSNKKFEKEVRHSKSRINAAKKNGGKGGRPKKHKPSANPDPNPVESYPAPAPAPTKEREETSGAARHKGLPMLESFSLDADMTLFAMKNGISDVPREFAKFKDHHMAKGSVFRNWTAAWRLWVSNWEDFSGGGRGKKSGKLTGGDLTRANLAAAGFNTAN
jgi:uncharacterized protein YdaU (DUF1376 family)